MSLDLFLCHLAEVASFSDKNNMTASNLAIVLGPSITWSKSGNDASSLLVQNVVLEYLISNYGEIKQFQESDGGAS